MNQIEKMYWDSLLEYLSTFKSDTFVFKQDGCEHDSQISVKYDRFDNGIEVYDDESDAFQYPASINVIAECNGINFDAGYSSTISIMFGDCSLWERKVGNYEPDFIISVLDEYSMQFVVEIDGFDYHDKTKEQAAKDKQRDRHFLRYGFIPIRFAGTEVYRNATDCVRETMQIIMEIVCMNKLRDAAMENWGMYLAFEKQERA